MGFTAEPDLEVVAPEPSPIRISEPELQPVQPPGLVPDPIPA